MSHDGPITIEPPPEPPKRKTVAIIPEQGRRIMSGWGQRKRKRFKELLTEKHEPAIAFTIVEEYKGDVAAFVAAHLSGGENA